MSKELKKEVVLQVKDLTKYFISKYGVTKAVDDVSFNMHKGEIVGLIGESGSGKTTVGNAIMGLLNEVNGNIRFEGVEFGRMSRKEKHYYRTNVQMIFQDPHTALSDKRNVFSTLAEPLKVNKIIKKEVNELMHNWKETTETFSLTLRKNYIESEIKFLKIKAKLDAQYINKIEKRFDNITLESTSPDILKGEVNSNFFHPFFKAQREYSVLLGESYSKYMKEYVRLSKKVDSRDLDKDEIDYLTALQQKEEYLKSIKDAKKIEKELARNEATLIKDIKAAKIPAKKFIKGMIDDTKRQIKFFTQLSQVSADPEVWKHYKLELKKSRIDKIILKAIAEESLIISLDDLDSLREKISLIRTQIINETKTEAIENATTDSKIIKLLSEKSEKEIKLLEKRSASMAEKLSEQKQAIIKKGLDKLDSAKIAKIDSKIKKTEEIAKKEKQIYLAKWQIEFDALVAEKEKLEADVKRVDFDGRFEKLYKELKIKFNNAVKEIPKGNKKSSKNAQILRRYILQQIEKTTAFKIDNKMKIKVLNQVKVLFGMKKHPFVKRVVRDLVLNERIFSALEEVGLKAEHAYRYPHEFSGGQKQRIVIARALIMKPKLIVADEPIASLDVSIQSQIINILKDLSVKKGITMLFIGHDLSVIEYLADTILVMHRGKIVERGAANLVYKKAVHPYTRTLLKSVPKISNANEPFKQIEIPTDYMREYIVEEPKDVQLKGRHFVLANKEQINKWKA